MTHLPSDISNNQFSDSSNLRGIIQSNLQDFARAIPDSTNPVTIDYGQSSQYSTGPHTYLYIGSVILVLGTL